MWLFSSMRYSSGVTFFERLVEVDIFALQFSSLRLKTIGSLQVEKDYPRTTTLRRAALSGHLCGVLVQTLPTLEPASDRGSLKLRALGRRVGREITSHSDENVQPFNTVTPLTVLLNAGLEHLIGMKVRILAQHGPSKRRD